MHDAAALMNITIRSAQTVCDDALGLETEPAIWSRQFFRQQFGGAGVSVLAQVAAASGQDDTYRSHLEALNAIHGARKSAGELKSLLKVAINRGYLKGNQAQPLIDKTDELIALLLAVAVTMRGATNPFFAA
jgi:four helix bundle protein